MKSPAVFLDRDGTLNRAFERGGVTVPPSDVAELELLPGVGPAVDRLRQAGFVLLIATNQPDVARGSQRKEKVDAINEVVRAELGLHDVLTCYHDTPDRCPCRKPEPGLLLEGARRWNVDVAASYMVGDRWSDVAAGQAAGCRTVLIETPFSKPDRCCPDRVARTLAEAVDWILTESRRIS
jgi:D-glycero-D-manno-heptose 1,7-bisphosphate phosphatase